MTALRPHRTKAVLRPDPRRVLARSFIPGEWASVQGTSRVGAVVDRVLAIPDEDVDGLLAGIRDTFGARHRDFDAILQRHAATVQEHAKGAHLSDERVCLLGAYFTQEYAVEGAALTNPSIVAAPDADGAGPDELAFILSARAIGEGHISSITFRTGVLDGEGEVRMDTPTGFVLAGTRREPAYDREIFGRQLIRAGADPDVVAQMTRHLPSMFSMDQLETWLRAFMDHHGFGSVVHEVVRLSHWLASANYIVTYPPRSAHDERVIFPSGPTESRGMEDARFVRFVDDDGTIRYLATYTAFDGFQIRPQLIDTPDFTTFRISTIHGVRERTKGMALFPRMIGGRYVTLIRPDHESIAVSSSDHLREWETPAQSVWRPSTPWDLIQLGNNGSPIETEAGWLVLTHGVGPMRRYVMGALLLDLDDPARPLGYLPHALLEPSEGERNGYVPNVVYSCGGLVHDGRLVVPYGFSDVGAGIATFALDPLLDRLTAAS
jgi:predicted GH43/DUF377 family glycosyl hydrolase